MNYQQLEEQEHARIGSALEPTLAAAMINPQSLE
jgi:hypothetical protein